MIQKEARVLCRDGRNDELVSSLIHFKPESLVATLRGGRRRRVINSRTVIASSKLNLNNTVHKFTRSVR